MERHGIRAVCGSTAQAVDFARELDRACASMPARVMMHLDLDCLDTAVGRANGYAAPGGLSAQDLCDCLDRLRARAHPVAMTIASFDPDGPGSGAIATAAIRAVRIAVGAGPA